MRIIDTHSHFNLSQFDADREETITRMRDAGVGTICIGIDEVTSRLAVEIADAHDNIWACIGIHPTEWGQSFDAETFLALSKKQKVVAVGECGLDYFREKERGAIDQQKELFKKQIEFAIQKNLPLMLHIRPEAETMPARPHEGSGAGGTAYEDALDILESYKNSWSDMRGTAHFFVGTKEIADRFLALGFYISFSGVITFVKEYEEIVAHTPLDRILSETDAPFATPAPYRGKRNEPTYVTEIVKKIAEIKNLPLEQVSTQLLQNAQTLFNLK